MPEVPVVIHKDGRRLIVGTADVHYDEAEDGIVIEANIDSALCPELKPDLSFLSISPNRSRYVT